MSFLWLYLVAFGTAFGVTFLSLPWWRSFCTARGLIDDPGHRKIHSTPVPLAGGVAVFGGVFLSLLAGVLLVRLLPSFFTQSHLLTHGIERRGLQLLCLLAGAVIMGGIGLLDDKIELRPGFKFGGQFAAAWLVALSGVRITLFVHSYWFSMAVTALWVLTVVNAFNFMDNMNGLCAGLGLIGAWYFSWSAAVQGQYLVTMLAAVATGALAGFLPFNYPRATVFLGDSGSHLVGYWMAVLAILPHFYTPQTGRTWAVLSPLFILAVPLVDLLWVVAIRWRIGKPFYVGDNNHLSHRLERLGLSRALAVALIWLASAACGAISFFLL
jgi:UDP-GlcNAc:undecaprenyl-phosphate GlcNAc-1-phosphate transferase